MARTTTISAMVALVRSMADPRARACAIASIMLVAFSCFAQDKPAHAPEASDAAQAAASESVTIPAETRLALVLTSPIASKAVHRGDMIYAQMTAPVAVENTVAIPAGSFVQGKVEKLSRNGSRAEIVMQSVSLIFPDGYVSNITGPLKIESDEGTAWRVPSKGGLIGAIAAPAIGGATGALIGHAAKSSSGTTINGLTVNPDRLQSTAIGGIAGLAAGGVVGLVLLTHSRQFYVEVGSPLETALPGPLTIAEVHSSEATHSLTTPAPPIAPVARRPAPAATPPEPSPSHICYRPDTPGTPPTVIPGTPPIGDSPGTPDIVIPGSPSIPGTPYPCD
jgi:hypothetical protein